MGEVADWVKGTKWHGAMYLDKTRQFYKATGNHKLGLSGFFMPSVIMNIVTHFNNKEMKNKVGHNNKGEGTLLGALYIFDTDGKLVYLHNEKVWGDKPDYEEVKGVLDRIKS